MNPASPYQYDLFLSYRHRPPDGSWVRNVLLPAIEGRGLSACIDFRDFRLGQPLIKEMERAVIASRHTVAVLSPAYIESNFADLEGVLAEHLGLEEGSRRLVAILREPCEPRLSLRAHLWLDMTIDGAFNSNVDRLAEHLRTG